MQVMQVARNDYHFQTNKGIRRSRDVKGLAEKGEQALIDPLLAILLKTNRV